MSIRRAVRPTCVRLRTCIYIRRTGYTPATETPTGGVDDADIRIPTPAVHCGPHIAAVAG